MQKFKISRQERKVQRGQKIQKYSIQSGLITVRKLKRPKNSKVARKIQKCSENSRQANYEEIASGLKIQNPKRGLSIKCSTQKSGKYTGLLKEFRQNYSENSLVNPSFPTRNRVQRSVLINTIKRNRSLITRISFRTA